MAINEWKSGRFNVAMQNISYWHSHTSVSNNTVYRVCHRDECWCSLTFQTVEPFQQLPFHVYGQPHSFNASNTRYLAVANHKSSYDTDSYIYCWDGAQFVHHQSIPTHGASGWDSFATAEDDVFLIVANLRTGGSDAYHVKSAVYKMADNKFNLYQQLPTTHRGGIRARFHTQGGAVSGGCEPVQRENQQNR